MQPLASPLQVRHKKAGDVVEHQLGRGRVVADDDEAGRHLCPRLAPELVDLLVVAVESVQGRLKLHRQIARVQGRGVLAPSLLGHLLADVLPQVAEVGHVAARNVVGDRHSGQLDDAALDGVHQREVAHRPREERPFGVARSAQEEGRRRQVHHAHDIQLALNRLQAGYPHACGFLVLLGLLQVVALETALLAGLRRLLPVAVVPLVVEDHDAL